MRGTRVRNMDRYKRRDVERGGLGWTAGTSEEGGEGEEKCRSDRR